MPFIQKTYVLGETIEIDKCYTARYNIKGEKRHKRYKPTPEQMRKHNRIQAEKKLRRLIKANFGEGDWHMTLTYDKKNRPEPEDAHRMLNNFLTSLRRYCKKNGFVLKYIIVTEYLNAAIHHHVIISDFDNIQQVCMKKWRWNTNWTPLYEGERVEVLAEYLIKETDKTFREDPVNKQRYSSSRNLKRPEPEVRVCSGNIAKEPQVPKKYRDNYVMDVDYYYFGVSETTGYASQSMILRRMTAKEKKKYDERKRKRIKQKGGRG
jgi:hypothetical protein